MKVLRLKLKMIYLYSHRHLFLDCKFDIVIYFPLQVLEKDLAIFGFFIALGRSTQGYLSSNGLTDLDDSLNGIVRYALCEGRFLHFLNETMLQLIRSFNIPA